MGTGRHCDRCLASRGNRSGSDGEEGSGAEAGPTALGLDIHPSHKVTTRGVWTWCRRCGRRSAGTKWHLLRHPCGVPTPGGLASLARVRRGLPPCYQAAEWGEGERDPGEGSSQQVKKQARCTYLATRCFTGFSHKDKEKKNPIPEWGGAGGVEGAVGEALPSARERRQGLRAEYRQSGEGQEDARRA